MKIIYQQVVPNPAKAREVVGRLALRKRDGLCLAGLVVGDASCVQRAQAVAEAWQADAEAQALGPLLEEAGAALFLQLPLVVKQGELGGMKRFLGSLMGTFGGYVTGDLGLFDHLRRELAGSPAAERLILTTNAVNRATALVLMERLGPFRLRPLMHRRTFIEEPVGAPRDVVIYGNMLLNASTFCLHVAEDTPASCRGRPCSSGGVLGQSPPALTLEGERVLLVGRSLYTDRRLDLLERIPYIPDLASVTLQDVNLGLDEIDTAARAISRYSAPGRAPSASTRESAPT